MEDAREFLAFCRKLLRCLEMMKKAFAEKDYVKAEELLDELLEDTKKDLED